MNTTIKILIVATLTVAVASVVALKKVKEPTQTKDLQSGPAAPVSSADGLETKGPSVAASKLPRLLDLGAGKCVPCKLMAPILEELKKEFAGKFHVEFIDVWQDPDAGKHYGVDMIPTQIFYDAEGQELFRHVGFYGRDDILGKWKDLGVDLTGSTSTGVVREQPVKPDSRPTDQICFMCDGDVQAKTKTLVQGQTEQRILCSPHCYFIYFSSIVGADPRVEDAKVSVTDWVTGNLVPGTKAAYLYGMDAQGRPTIKALADREAAAKEQQQTPGNIVSWDLLRSKEMATRCGFCDRAVYPEDACKITVGGSTHAYGCCTHCSMGVAARTGKDIEVEAYDGLTRDMIKVKTLDGMIASLEPPTAVAWFGQKKSADGQWKSAGCFKQGFFANQENLKGWLDARPAMTGRQITIAKALADKMKLTPEQIAKACKLGECK